MPKKIIVSFVCALLALNAFAKDSDVLTDLQHKTYTVASLKGKWVIVNYWATWCRPCMMETPELNNFYSHMASDTMLFGVSYDEGTPSQLDTAASREGIKFPVLTEDPVAVLDLGQTMVMPTTFIINPDGKLVKTIQGMTTENTLAEQLKSLRSDFKSH
jgi:peroxiredoxin